MMAPSVTLNDIKSSLDSLRAIVLAIVLGNKDVFNIEELCEYAGLTKLYVYKLTSTRGIPFYCPRGKFLYFKRTEIDDWLLQNRIKPLSEIETQAANQIAGLGG